MEKKDIVIVVPVYLSLLSKEDRVALNQCVSVLSEYDIVVIKPESLDLDNFILSYPSLKIRSFSDSNFVSLRSYNKLVLDEMFYQYFVSYRYMLIYQLDAYVFKDELLEWAEKGYDYIGAPWTPWDNKYLSPLGRTRLSWLRSFWQLVNPSWLNQDKYYWYQVGNGGFSLRNVSKMLDITRFYKSKIDEFLDDDKPFSPEDIFLLMELTDEKHQLARPPFEEAVKFAMEHNPEWAYKYNNSQLPFGCHNWYGKYMWPFWSRFINCSIT